MGSGTTAKAAIAANRKYIGSEISEEYCKIIDKRLEPMLNNLFTNL
jgi:site-specific DNA-methyltransferase (adenine-specific)